MSLLQLSVFPRSLTSYLRKGYTLEEIQESGRILTGDVEKSELKSIYNTIHDNCYPECSTISGETPKGDGFEAIKMRFARRRDANILEFLVDVRLHGKSVTANVRTINFAKCLADIRVSPKKDTCNC
eukprot:8838680-Ditylum_brightwellii.AAC.1